MASGAGSNLAVIEGNASLEYGTPVLRNKTHGNREAMIGSDVSGVKSSTPTRAYETPTRGETTPSKFVFLSDRKSVPTEMKNLQERTIKRRRDFLAQIHEMVRA